MVPCQRGVHGKERRRTKKKEQKEDIQAAVEKTL
jgi:hypothetical protein